MIEEVEKLLTHSVEYATEILTDTGECYPFGAFLDTIGNVHPLEMEVEDTKNMPTIGKVINGLTIYCETEYAAAKMRGYALAYEVKLQLEVDAEPIDAICFEMTHCDQPTIDLYYLPFKSLGDKKATIGELFAVKR